MSYQLRIEATVDISDEDGLELVTLLYDGSISMEVLAERSNDIVRPYLSEITMRDVTDWEVLD
jgi:hypothetical protein